MNEQGSPLPSGGGLLQSAGRGGWGKQQQFQNMVPFSHSLDMASRMFSFLLLFFSLGVWWMEFARDRGKGRLCLCVLIEQALPQGSRAFLGLSKGPPDRRPTWTT